MPKTKSKQTSTKPFGLDRVTLIIVIGVLIIGFFLGAQYMKNKNRSIIPDQLVPISSTVTPTAESNQTNATVNSITKPVPSDWNTTQGNLWGPGDQDGGKYWQLTISLPPGLKFVSGGSEEFITAESDPSANWDMQLDYAEGSRRQQYKRYVEYTGGTSNGKPLNTCTITSSREIPIDNSQTYLDVEATCTSKNSDGSLYTQNLGAYLYNLQGMFLFIKKAPNGQSNQLLEPYLKDIFSSLKLSM